MTTSKYGKGFLKVRTKLGLADGAARAWLKLCVAGWLMGMAGAAAETPRGLIPRFNTLPPPWVARKCQPMDQIWAPLGVKGTNYYSFPGPAAVSDTYSARSDPSSRFYQAWFGVYVIIGRASWLAGDGSINFSDFFRVGECDQNAWLRAMGDEHPQTGCVATEKLEPLLIAGKTRSLFKVTLRSHSDLNSGKAGLAAALGMPKPEQWNRDLEPYHDVLLTGLLSTWYEPGENATVVVYASATGYRTKDGRTVDYFPSLQKDLLSMVKGVEFEGRDLHIISALHLSSRRR